MDVTARLRYVRISPRKVRPLLDIIRGRSVAVAEAQLTHLPKAAAHPLVKLLKSAQANAEHNFKLDPNNLYVKRAFADEGPKLKRYQPRAMGRATLIRKRSSHVTIVLAPIKEQKVEPGESRTSAPTLRGTKVVKGAPAEPRVTTKQRRPTLPHMPKTPQDHISHPAEKWREKREKK